MKAFWNMTRMELKLFMREPSAAFFTLVFPLILLSIFGSIFGNNPISKYGGRGTVDTSVPGYIGMIIATTGLMALPITLAAYREKGILGRFSATPISIFTLLWSQVTVNLIMLTLGSLGLVLLGVFGFGLALPSNWAIVGFSFLFSATSFMSLGFLIGGLMPSARSANAAGMALFFPMLFMSGAAMPLELLPAKMRAIAELLPLTHVVELIKNAWFGNGLDTKAFVVLLGMLGLCALISKFSFRWN